MHSEYLVILLFGVPTVNITLKIFILKIFEVEPSGEEILNKICMFSARLTLTHQSVGKFGQLYEQKNFL